MSFSDPGATATSDPLGQRASSGQFGEGQSTKDQAQEKAQEVAGQAKDQAQQAAGQAKDRARSVVDERSTQAGQQVTQQAGDLRTVGDSLREQGKEGPAKIADQAADRAERVGHWLEHSSADDILHDLEDLGRKQPWVVALGGLAAGFAASRFLKASSSQRYEQIRTTGRPVRSRPPLPPRTTVEVDRTGTATDVGVGVGVGSGAGTPGGLGHPVAPPVPPTPVPGTAGL